MDTAQKHLSASELEESLEFLLATPQNDGVLAKIFIRPRVDERESLESVELSLDAGIAGDCWATDHYQKLPDGSSDPQAQVSLMNARVLERIAGDEEAMSLAGDNLIVDLDLSEANLPVGARLAVGAEVVLELTAVPHTGCGKFLRRFGKAAREFVNSPVGSTHNLRGRYARIITGGRIRIGDGVRKV